MELLLSLIILITIGMLWAAYLLLITRGVSGETDPVELRVVFGGFMVILGLSFVVAAGIGTFEYMETNEFCGEVCHSMKPKYDDKALSYQSPQNNSMMATHVDEGVRCIHCHDGPGLDGKLVRMLKGTHELQVEVFGNWEADELGGHVPNLYCTKCHDGSVAPEPGTVTTALGTEVDPHGLGTICAECHNPHETSFGLTEEACSWCHGTEYKDFESNLEAHGNRTALTGDCWDCHNRAHPENARISFMEYPALISDELCSDCHVKAYTSVTTYENLSLELYGGCTDCHIDHKQVELPHLRLTDDCAQCHANYQDELVLHGIDVEVEMTEDCQECHVDSNTAKDIHDRTGVSFVGFSPIPDAFCEDCHFTQEPSLDLGEHSSRECSDCHQDHRVLVDFTECVGCHDETNVLSHTPEMDDCADCHGEDYADVIHGTEVSP